MKRLYNILRYKMLMNMLQLFFKENDIDMALIF